MSVDVKARETALLVRAHAFHELCRTAGADQAEVSLIEGTEFSCSYRDETLDRLEEASSSGLGVRLFKDGRVMTGSTSDLAPAVVRGLVDDLLAAAAHLDPDEHSTLAAAEDLDGVHLDLGQFDPATAADPASLRLERARAAEAAVRAADERVSATDGASFSAAWSSAATVASNGLERVATGGWQSVVADAICDDKDGKKRNGYWFSTARRLDGLADPAEVGRIAAERAVARLGASKPKTGAYPVVWDRLASPALIGLLTSVLTATAVWRKSTYLADRLGSRIGSDLLTLIDDPLLPGLLGSSSVDGEGRARRRNVLVENGVLKTFLAAQYASNRTGIPCTASAGRPLAGTPSESTTNLFLKPGEQSPEELIAGIDEGIFLQGTIGFGFNAVTGDFSRGGYGFMIRGGELAEPIAEFTVSSPFDELLGAVDAVADDLVWDRRSAVPTLRVAEMAIGGTG
jgi:PmbA protein